jgi:hypothetical protein
MFLAGGEKVSSVLKAMNDSDFWTGSLILCWVDKLLASFYESFQNKKILENSINFFWKYDFSVKKAQIFLLNAHMMPFVNKVSVRTL